MSDHDPISQIAKDHFHVTYLYPIQRFVISNTLEGKNQIVVLPTGAGKSICFQLPSLILKGPTVVVVPLLSLLKDQLLKCRQFKLQAGALKGGQSAEERKRVLKEIGEGRIRLVFTTPEALSQPRLREVFSRFNISHFVLDEAHCVWEWGRSFRPAYLKIGEILKSFKIRTVSAFTATATQSVLNKIRKIVFSDREAAAVIGDPDRPNIRYLVLPVLSRARALSRIVESEERPLLIFSRSRLGAEKAATTIRRRFPKEKVFFYHAGLFPEERAEVESWFLGSSSGILAATSAYGLGVDKPDIRTVAHLDVPPSIEAYLQESGRAGRDGSPARAILLYSQADIHFAEQLNDSLESSRYARMLDYALNQARCRREALISYFGVENIYCSGCDICAGETVSRPEAEEKILSMALKSMRAYTLRQLQQILSGKKSYEVIRQSLFRAAGFGLLSDWHSEDISEALLSIIESGMLYIPKKGFWKNRVTIRK